MTCPSSRHQQNKEKEMGSENVWDSLYNIIAINSHKIHLPHQGLVLPGNHL